MGRSSWSTGRHVGDALWQRQVAGPIPDTFMRFAGVRFGRLECSRWTGFESPDPVFWTAAGYVVVQADVRGMHSPTDTPVS
jgi:predicted acyl esterase